MPKITSDRIVILPSDRDEFKNVSQNITLSEFRAILNTAARGEPMRLFKFSSEIVKKDPMIAQAIDTRSKSVLGLEWKITSDNKEAAEDLEEFLRNIKGSALDNIKDFDQFLSTLVGETYLTGVRVNELLFDSGTFIGFNTIPSHLLIYTQSISVPNLYTDDSIGTKFNRDKVVVHYSDTSEVDHTNGYMAECLGWLYVYKTDTNKNALKYSERYGQPILVASIEGDGDGYDKEVTNCQSIINSLKVPGAVFTGNTNLEFVESKASGNGEIFQKLNVDYDKYIQLRVLGQTSSAEAEDSNRSTAKEHMKVLNKLIASDAKMIEHTINDQVLPKIIENMGNYTDDFRFEFIYDNPEEELIKAEVQEKQIDIISKAERVGAKQDLIDKGIIEEDSEVLAVGAEDGSETSIKQPTYLNEGFDDKTERALTDAG